MCELCMNDVACDECGAGPGETCLPYCTAPYGPGGPHEHDGDPVTVVPLPAHLAATAAARAAETDVTMPHPGDPVVIHNGDVIWLERYGAAGPADESNARMWGTPIYVRGDANEEYATWSSICALDPDFLGIDEDDARDLAEIQRALIEHANTATPNA